MNKFDKVVRILSVAPIMAALMLIILIIGNTSLFSSIWTFSSLVASLGILPLLAYPLQKYIPKFKDEGRKGQRTLAMIFAVCGYFLAAILLLIFKGNKNEWLIALCYLISGIILTVFNKVFKLLASGHACGVAGPIALLTVFRSYIASAVGCIWVIVVCISSVRSKRHTVWQFLGGAAISTLSALAISLILI